MNNSGGQAYWQKIYSEKAETEVSWFQESPAISLELIEKFNAGPDTRIADIGGGASRLVDWLLEKGFQSITVLDLSDVALSKAKGRLGDKARSVTWIADDATTWEPPATYDIWHDRATFHFFTDMQDRGAYLQRLGRSLRVGGHAIIATFALDGPERCSGLPIVRYSPETLAETLGDKFELIETQHKSHVTPWGAKQSFHFSVFRHVG
jgi:SAM-dependent methyltransferase